MGHEETDIGLLFMLALCLGLLPKVAFAQSFTITIPNRNDAIVSVTVDGAKHEEGETFSVEAGTQVSAQGMQLSSKGAMFTGWSVSPEGAVELGNTKIVKFSMPAQTHLGRAVCGIREPRGSDSPRAYRAKRMDQCGERELHA
ncbi:MAG TPA: hypothetical protein IAA43_04425 [Candidatus Olsenella avicola]|nr:hypothetical protein [Candidatus Olsenella avicola]